MSSELSIDEAEALTRAILYLSVAMSNCTTAPIVREGSVKADLAPGRRAHWGTLPVAAFCLANLALLDPSAELIIGGGHAGIAQVAFAWLRADLAKLDDRYRTDAKGLTALCRDYPNYHGIGGEVSPRLPFGRHVGGLIGGALAFAIGFSQTTPSRSYVLIGDGELETPTTAAAWLAASTFAASGLVPIVNLNQFRMGSRSAISMLSDDETIRYFGGQGWEARLLDCLPRDPSSHRVFRSEITACGGGRRVLVLRNRKGQDGYWSMLDNLALTESPLHKAPLELFPTTDRVSAVESWLASYRPWELFTTDYRARGMLARAIARLDLPVSSARVSADLPTDTSPQRDLVTFADAVVEAVENSSDVDDVWILSPDELASNGLGARLPPDRIIEILAEEVLGFMQSGLAAGGARSLLVSYEAFATLLTPGINALLKTLKQIPVDARPSTNVLLTSYGWENSFTHGDPTFTSMLVCNPDDRVNVTFPHSTQGLYTALADGLRSCGRVNVVVAGKRHLRPGVAWADGAGYVAYGASKARVVLAMGDLAANVALDARQVSAVPLSVFVVEKPSALQSEALWESVWRLAIEKRRSVLFLTITYPWAVEAMIPAQVRPFVEVRGWIDESAPLEHNDRLVRSELTPEAVLRFFTADEHAADL